MTDRIDLMRQWLESLGYMDYELSIASADASFRQYYRIKHDGLTFIIMDAPPEHEDCRPYINVSDMLLQGGLNVPRIINSDLEKGFLLLTDLGETLYLDILSDDNVDELYHDAVEALLKIQGNVQAQSLPPYDAKHLQNEMDLFRDWLLDKHLDLFLDKTELESLSKIFCLLVSNAQQQPQCFVHRDYHSRNLLWSEENNPGILDFQDAVYGPLVYDLVSLLKDCYIKWPRERIIGWIEQFYARCKIGNIELEEFIRWFDLMGVQRQLKASGIFARLWHRDGKPGYLKDIPRTLSYISDLEGHYPELEPLIDMIRKRVLPGLDKVTPA